MDDISAFSMAYQQGCQYAVDHNYPMLTDIPERDCPFRHGTFSAQAWYHGLLQTLKPETKYNNKIRDLSSGQHIFVFARPISRDWSEFDGTTLRQGHLEWRPCMIKGLNESQSLYVIGSPYAYALDHFEIGADIAG